METIAIIIPTMFRFARIPKILENIKRTTKTPHKVYFVIESIDEETILAARGIGADFMINHGGTYVSAINLAYESTTEPYLMLAADDVVFTEGWDKKMLAKFTNGIGIVGHYDDWPIGKTGKHGSHLMVSRKYIKDFGGVEGQVGTIYYSGYNHYQCDIETEQTAMKRVAYAQSDAVIDHNHWINGKAEKDECYVNGLRSLAADTALYNRRRKNFEQYVLEDLQGGKVTPVSHVKLSIVMGSYNAPDALRATIESLYQNTCNEFELILVDDCSTDPDTLAYLAALNKPNITKIMLRDHRYTDAVWNMGAKLAKGDYICISNNDITYSKNWDMPIIEALRDPDILIASPYQTDAGCSTPYGFAERAGGIALRGTCYMMTAASCRQLFPIPENLVMWFGDYWLAWKVIEKLKKKTVFVPGSVVHDLGSKSSKDLQKGTGLLWWIIRGDCFEFTRLTGINTDHWYNIVWPKCIEGRQV